MIHANSSSRPRVAADVTGETIAARRVIMSSSTALRCGICRNPDVEGFLGGIIREDLSRINNLNYYPRLPEGNSAATVQKLRDITAFRNRHEPFASFR